MAAQYEDRFWTSGDGLSLHYRNYPGPEGSSALPVPAKAAPWGVADKAKAKAAAETLALSGTSRS